MVRTLMTLNNLEIEKQRGFLSIRQMAVHWTLTRGFRLVERYFKPCELSVMGDVGGPQSYCLQ